MKMVKDNLKRLALETVKIKVEWADKLAKIHAYSMEVNYGKSRN